MSVSVPAALRGPSTQGDRTDNDGAASLRGFLQDAGAVSEGDPAAVVERLARSADA